VIFPDETAPISSPMKAKVSVSSRLWRTAAVSNELYDAIGAPVRDAPMTLDKLVSGLPPL